MTATDRQKRAQRASVVARYVDIASRADRAPMDRVRAALDRSDTDRAREAALVALARTRAGGRR